MTEENDMGPGMEVQTYDRATVLGRRWFFRIVDLNNHEKLAASQTYKTERQRDRTADRFSRLLRCPIRKVRK